MALILSGSISMSGSLSATTIVIQNGGGGIVSSSQQIQNYDVFGLNSNLYNSTGSINSQIAGIQSYTSSLKGASIVSSSQQITNYFRFAETSSANTTFYGNVGIGTTNPAYKLDVNGTVNFSGALTGTSATFSSTAFTNLTVNGTNTNGWGNNIAFKSEGTDFGYIGSVGSLLSNTTKDITIWATSGNGFRVYTNGNNERLNITSAGVASFPNTTNATNTATGAITTAGGLSVAKDVFIGGLLDFNPAFYGDGVIVNNSNGGLAFNVGLTPSTKMYLTSTGNVGIGTSSPFASARLQVNTGTNLNLAVQTGTLDSSGIKLNAFNDAGSANIPIELNGSILYFKTAETERMRITSDGYLRLAGAGIQFNGDTAAANSLDDYEEGTWTPTIRGSGTAGTYELSSVSHYTKIGRQVTLTIQIALAGSITGGGTNYMQIQGLPFTKLDNSFAIGPVSTNGLDTVGNYLTVQFISLGAGTTLFLSEVNDNAANTDFPIANLSANDGISFSITYFV